MRDVLRYLTARDLAALSSPGLVSRAQRDLEEGLRPMFDERPDGAIAGTFADGTEAVIGVGPLLRQTSCSCRASALCRHRIALALAWREAHGPLADEMWTPAAFTDAQLLAACGKRTLERARKSADKGGSVEVQRQPPLVRLPTCTVRFMVPRDLGYALCDCNAGPACEHVALAVWAFQRSAAKADASQLDLRLSPTSVDDEVLGAAVTMAREILRDGVRACGSAMDQRFAVVTAGLRKSGCSWPALLLEDLAQTLADFHQRHARYSPSTVTALLAELTARARAARGHGELSPAFVLGSDTPLETVLDRVRLVSLGARVEAVEEGLQVDVYLADPDAANVLVLRKTLAGASGWEARDRELGSDVRLQAVAHSQLLSEGMKRRANRLVSLPQRRGRARSSVSPLFGAWEALPTPVRIVDLTAHLAWRAAQAPAMLRPRVLAENVHVIAVSSVDEVVFSPGAQELRASVTVAPGVPLRVVRRYHRATPGALPALATALRREVRAISGVLTAGGLEPLAVLIDEDEVVVPDLAAGGDLGDVARGYGSVPPSPLAHAVRRVRILLDEAAHGGLAHLSARWLEATREAARGAREVGLERLANLLEELAATPGCVDAERWENAALRCMLLDERL